MNSRAKVLAAVLVVLLAGCGSVEWFPAYVPPEAPAVVAEEPAGAFILSERNAITGEWFTTTAGGVFRMYTSTPFARREPLVLETTTTGERIIRRKLIGAAKWYEVKL